MYKLSLEDGGHRPMSRSESIESVVVHDCCGQPTVYDHGCGLPLDLHQLNALEVLGIPLGDKYYPLPGTCLSQGTFTKKLTERV